jgi:hypothetical protein
VHCEAEELVTLIHEQPHGCAHPASTKGTSSPVINRFIFTNAQSLGMTATDYKGKMPKIVKMG